MARKKKELDKLSLDMIECKKAGYGCHYGDWYAAQNRPVKIEKKVEIPEGWIACLHCGKYFKPYSKMQKYCEISCQKAAQKIRDGDKWNEYYRLRNAQRRAEQRRAKAVNES